MSLFATHRGVPYEEHKGVAILAGRTLSTEQDNMGIVIFTAHADEEARALMDADPAVSKGVMSAKLFPFRIALQARAGDPGERIQTGTEDK